MPNVTQHPTPKDLNVLRTISELRANMGYPPTVEEIRAELDAKSSFGIRRHIDHLQNSGLVTRAVGKIARGLVITEAGKLKLK